MENGAGDCGEAGVARVQSRERPGGMGQEAGKRSGSLPTPVSARAPDLTSGRRSTGSSGPAAPRPRVGRGLGRSRGPGGRGRRPWAQGCGWNGSQRRHGTPRGSSTSAFAGGVA